MRNMLAYAVGEAPDELVRDAEIEAPPKRYGWVKWAAAAAACIAVAVLIAISSIGGSGPEAQAGGYSRLPGLPSTALPAGFDIDSDEPFASLTQVKALFPLVCSYTLSDEETAELVSILTSATDMQRLDVNYSWDRHNLWAELDFSSGESWLLMGYGEDFTGAVTLTIADNHYRLPQETAAQLLDLFSRCEVPLQESAGYEMPFEYLKAEELVSVEYTSGSYEWERLWERLDDTELVNRLVDILVGIRVNVPTGTHKMPDLYGCGEPYFQFRLTYTDGSVVTIGGWGYGVCISGIHYGSRDNGLMNFYDSLPNSV